jgi:hypothetical protein
MSATLDLRQLRNLKRLGIDPEKWLEHEERLDSEAEFIVRVVGGEEMLKSALEASATLGYSYRFYRDPS